MSHSLPHVRFLRAGVLALVSLAWPGGTVLAQYSDKPPVPDPARWSGRIWATAEMEPKIVTPGDDVTITLTLQPTGGPHTPGWSCTGGGWAAFGTGRAEVNTLSGCFDLVDYEPKASANVTVGVGRSSVVWTGAAGPLPTFVPGMSAAPDAACTCHVGWFGASGRVDGCSKPLGLFGAGQRFIVRLRAKSNPSCSTNGRYRLLAKNSTGTGTSVSGWYGIGWSNEAEFYYRFDYNATNTPVPTIEVTADPVSVPLGEIATVRAVVTDATTNAPMPGQSVTFSATVGLLSALSAVTDAGGVATVTLADDGQPGASRIVGRIPQASDTAEVEFTGTPGMPGGGGGGGGNPADPGPVLRQYFAEGATGPLFTTDLALANPGTSHARARLKFLTDAGQSIEQEVTIQARSRKSVRLNTDVPGLGAVGVATVVESTVPLVADRTMTWDATGYGSHTETGVAEPRTRWYLAEGATHSGFDLFYLVQNPGEAAATVDITYLRPIPQPPVTRRHTLKAGSRYTIWVNQEGSELASTDVSAVIDSSLPVIVERAMYLGGHARMFDAGHESAAIAEPSQRWFFAEGATGPYFDLFLLLANPGAAEAKVRATYLLPDGTTVEKSYDVAPQSRRNVWVDLEGGRLADTAVSTVLESTNGVPFIAERAMWWPGPSWHEAHNAPGSTRTGARWGVAGCEVGGPRGAETYVLVANTSATAAQVRLTLLFEDGSTLMRLFGVGARSRFQVNMGDAFPQASGRRFAVTVEALGETPAQLVVERAVYSNARGVSWAAGSNALGTLLP